MSNKKDKKEEQKENKDLESEQEQQLKQDNFPAAIKEEEFNKAQNTIVILEKEVEDLRDRLLRKAAEFDNYKRRTENDQLNLLKYAAENFIIKLLPVIDDFERSMQHMKGDTDIEKIKEGVQLVYDKFMKMLDSQGVKKINSVGTPFDVNYHEAIMQKPDKDVEPHTVLDEVESGYMYKDRVIRHAKVIVSEDTGNKG